MDKQEREAALLEKREIWRQRIESWQSSGEREHIMDYREMTSPCGLDCFNCVFFLAQENPDAQAQIEQWSREYDIPLEIMQCRGSAPTTDRYRSRCTFLESHIALRPTTAPHLPHYVKIQK